MKKISPKETVALGLHGFAATPGKRLLKRTDGDARLYAAAKGWRIVGLHDEIDATGVTTWTFWCEPLLPRLGQG